MDTVVGQPRRPLPFVDLDAAPFWAGLREHKLLLQRCAQCGIFRHPPRPMCPSCNSFEVEWVESAGLGNVYSWIVVRQGGHPAFGPNPFNVALIELREGIRLISNLVDIEPAEIQADLPVVVTFIDVDDGMTLHQFRVVKG